MARQHHLILLPTVALVALAGCAGADQPGDTETGADGMAVEAPPRPLGPADGHDLSGDDLEPT